MVTALLPRAGYRSAVPDQQGFLEFVRAEVWSRLCRES